MTPTCDYCAAPAVYVKEGYYEDEHVYLCDDGACCLAYVADTFALMDDDEPQQTQEDAPSTEPLDSMVYYGGSV